MASFRRQNGRLHSHANLTQILIHISDCDGGLAEMPRKRRVKEGGSLAHLPMGCERMAASVPPFPTSLANAGKMPALVRMHIHEINQ
jgi:hypothetical protein